MGVSEDEESPKLGRRGSKKPLNMLVRVKKSQHLVDEGAGSPSICWGGFKKPSSRWMRKQEAQH